MSAFCEVTTRSAEFTDSLFIRDTIEAEKFSGSFFIFYVMTPSDTTFVSGVIGTFSLIVIE